MSVIGQVVIHKKLGKGIICNYKSDSREKYIIVSFLDQDKEIMFLFPGSFENFLKAEDIEFQKEIDLLLEEKVNENILKKAQAKLEKEKEERYFLIEEVSSTKSNKSSRGSSINSINSRANTRNKANSSSKGANLIFKLNYCDGGMEENAIGFNGICSDEIIKNNIVNEKRTWCIQPECDCYKYHKGEITREELDAILEKGFTCYEGQLLKEWTCYAGVSHSKDKKGKPKTIKRAQKDKLCFLSTREPNTREEDRFIFGVFLIDEVFVGDECLEDDGEVFVSEGFVKSKSSYKIKLTNEEAQKVRFWNYHQNNNGKIVWNSGLFRYIEDEEALNILEAIVKVKENTEDEERAKNLLNYFKAINKL